ncbi:MAG: HPr(Ser) kinase/phosphatase [Clostridiales bacterium]|jgi:HPr kinase/phosphorylase|nr:HPr(Ser) kinase/phosphatase [Clostridiales bacterium]
MKSLNYKVRLTAVAEKFSLEFLYKPQNINEIYVSRADLSRPGLPLAGFFKHFENERIQLIGNMETGYLEGLTPDERYSAIEKLLQHHIVALVVTTNLPAFPELIELAKTYNTPVLRTAETTSAFTAALSSYLNVELAERITTHGVMVEVYGEGILILGDSGIGKSETAIELVKRGHRFIADDAVVIKKVSAITLLGSAPESIKHYIELRGIGIVDVKRIFGVGAVKDTEKIDLVIKFENWVPGKDYERIGLNTESEDILGIAVPAITIPVKPGRNLAVIIEIAAMNHRQKKMGYDTAMEFMKRLEELDTGEEDTNVLSWH